MKSISVLISSSDDEDRMEETGEVGFELVRGGVVSATAGFTGL